MQELGLIWTKELEICIITRDPSDACALLCPLSLRKYQNWVWVFHQRVCPPDTVEGSLGAFEWPWAPSLTTGPHSGLFTDQDNTVVLLSEEIRWGKILQSEGCWYLTDKGYREFKLKKKGERICWTLYNKAKIENQVLPPANHLTTKVSWETLGQNHQLSYFWRNSEKRNVSHFKLLRRKKKISVLTL